VAKTTLTAPASSATATTCAVPSTPSQAVAGRLAYSSAAAASQPIISRSISVPSVSTGVLSFSQCYCPHTGGAFGPIIRRVAGWRPDMRQVRSG
jgi:hypothetical protein